MKIDKLNQNPILKPNREQSWEAQAVFNGCPAVKGRHIYLLYRALSLPHYHSVAKTLLSVSDIGIAKSVDGINFSGRKRFIIPENEWERYGCEDPRVTKLGNTYYIFYTALSSYPFSADGIKVGVALSKDLESIYAKYPVTPFNAKGMALFPSKIKGKFYSFLTVHTDRPPARICIASFDKESDIWSQEYWQRWYKDFEKHSIPLGRLAEDHIEVGSPPVKTKYGWLIFYSHIKNYFSHDRFFTIEVALLDLNDPHKILARSSAPIMYAQEYYEKFGMVPNIVFPSGALLKKNTIMLYYGAADTTCCAAEIDLKSLLSFTISGSRKTGMFERAKKNPVISPIKDNAWEAKATFNPAAIDIKGSVHILYRATSEEDVSVLGYARSSDGISIDYRAKEPVYIHRESPGGGGIIGCEDPRLTKIGEDIYMCYTAFDGSGPPRVALTSIKVSDFIAENWVWKKPVLISPPDIDDKDALVFPEKVLGKYMIIHRVGEDVDLGLCSSLNFSGKRWLEEFRWFGPRKGWWDSKKVGAAAPPIKIKDGWIFLYHGVSDDGIYRVGALLLDNKNPTKILGRTDRPLFEPGTSYEKEGIIPNVVFPCGAVVRNKKIIIYYGGADRVVGIASMNIKDLLDILKSCVV